MGTRKKFGYAKRFNDDLDFSRQMNMLMDFGILERDIVCDEEGNKHYLALRDSFLHKGDTLVISSIDKISYAKSEIKKELEILKERGIRLVVLDIPTTNTNSPIKQDLINYVISNILIEVLASIDKFERDNMKKKQALGIKLAKKEGKHMGRPKYSPPSNWDEIYYKYKVREIKAFEAIEQLGIKKSTFYKLVSQIEKGK